MGERDAGLQAQLDSVAMVQRLALATGRKDLYRAAALVLSANETREAAERTYGLTMYLASAGETAWAAYMAAVDTCSAAWAQYDALCDEQRGAA
jgi:hypothetical protein